MPGSIEETRSEATVRIARLAQDERDEWEMLFRAYIDFYQRTEPQIMYDRAWDEFQTDERMHALGASIDGHLAASRTFWFMPAPRRVTSATCRTYSRRRKHAGTASAVH